MQNARRRALLSVSDKTGLVDFARGLTALGFELLSTGGTASALREAGLVVTSVSEVTGFPEIMGGRVKTLHPRVHGGLLGRWDVPEDVAAARENGIEPIELLCVNLYPFRETIARAGVTLPEAVEQIDIGGPAMVRAAAKNHDHTLVVVSPTDYAGVLAALQAGAPDTAFRRNLAARAFTHTAAYDAAIAEYLTGELLPETLVVPARRVQALRYGENPHQTAAFYEVATPSTAPSLARARQLQGKELSYNNILDLDAALGVALDLRGLGAVVVKHTNPCGAAEGLPGETLAEVYLRARATDPTSAFGGIVGLNREVDAATAERLAETFLEAVIAPAYSAAALEILGKKKNVRLMALSPWPEPAAVLELRSVSGGLLAQSRDTLPDDLESARVATRRSPTPDERAGLDLAWRVARHVKSNAIVYARPGQILAVGAGQMSRLDSARVAASKAKEFGHELRGSAVASDAFFPFADGLLVCAEAGAVAFIQPGGSVRDDEVIAAADGLDIAMLFTGHRHFKH
jgi:phosphoribosylaminoimidazolecarboxamide formyltransferase/IMP cyclohydrolase